MTADTLVFSMSRMLPWLVPLFAAIATAMALRLYWPAVAGWLGERKVKRLLKALPADRYTVLNELMLTCRDGESTLIEHVVIGPTTIFVIHTRNHAGRIFGRAPEPQWRQLLSRHNAFSFRNPLHCNERHVQAVEDAVGQLPVHGVVVFLRGDFAGEAPEGVATPQLLPLLIREKEEAGQPIDREAVAGWLQAGAITAARAKRLQRKKMRQHQGDRLRLPMAHTLLLLAAALLLIEPPTTSGPASAPDTIDTPANKYTIPAPPPARKAAAPKPASTTPARTIRKPAPMSYEIIMLGQGIVSLKVDGKIITLREGQKKDGWRLLSASTRHAELIRPDGKRLHHEP